MSQTLAHHLVVLLNQRQWRIRCVESCTAGALTAAIGQVAGVSSVLDRSWVTYSNQAKIEEVGVTPELIETYGAVSKEVAQAMAEGAVSNCEETTLSIAITGIAGPSGGTTEKPIGTVWLGLKAPQQTVQSTCSYFHGTRSSIQASAVNHALHSAVQYLEKI